MNKHEMFDKIWPGAHTIVRIGIAVKRCDNGGQCGGAAEVGGLSRRYACICTDKPGAGELRQQTRETHLAHLREHESAVVSAGPLLSGNGEPPIGSLLIVEAGSLDEARAMIEADPYTKAGVFARVDVHPWRWVLGTVNLQE